MNRGYCAIGMALWMLLASGQASARDVLYYTEQANHRIMCVELDGSNPRLVLDTGEMPCGLRVDPLGDRMYWTEPFAGKVRSAKLDGSDARELWTGVDWMSDLAIDPVQQSVYVTQYNTGLIFRGQMSGGLPTPIIDTNGGCPYGIEYSEGQIFWADWFYLHNYVRKANADGTQVTTLTSSISGLQTLTVYGDWVYIGDVNKDVIYRAHRDGSNLSTFVSALNPWGMAVSDGMLFWSSHNESLNLEVGGSLQCVSLSGGEVQTLLVDPVRPWGVAIVDTASIPEPTTMLSLSALVCLSAYWRRRR